MTLNQSQTRLLYSVSIHILTLLASSTSSKIDDMVVSQIKSLFPPLSTISLKEALIEILEILAKDSENKVDDKVISLIKGLI